MKIEVKNQCPLNGFKPCRELDCAWFMKVVGKHPQTGADVEEWGCAVTWMPVLTIENSQQQRQTGAAVESFRNEMVRANRSSQELLLASTQNQHALEKK